MKKAKPYDQMNVKELGDATKDLDEEFVFEKGREMSPQERREFDAWRKLANDEHLQRKRLGYGCKRVQVSMERSLLAKADAYARFHGMSRAAIVSKSVEMFLQSVA